MKIKTFSLCMIFFVLLICATVTASDNYDTSSDIATSDSSTSTVTTTSDTSSTGSSTHTDTSTNTASSHTSDYSSTTTSSSSSTSTQSNTDTSTSSSSSTTSSESTKTSTYESDLTSKTVETSEDTLIETSDDTILVENATQDDMNDIIETLTESSTTSDISNMTKITESIITTENTVSNVIENIDISTLSSVDSTQVELSSDEVSSITSITSEKTDLKGASTYTLTGNVTTAYNSETGQYAGDELEGFPAANATVTLAYTSNGKQVAKVKTDANGIYTISGLDAGNYTITFEYGTYAIGEEYINLNKNDEMDYIFIPDLVIITYSGDGDQGQYNKYQALRKLSDRFLFLESYDLDTTYDNSNQWMLDFANFILVDMYAEGLGFGIDTDLIKESPASQNNMIAYTFGIYNDGLLMSLGWGYVGDSPYSLENTYIGSYWQAEAISDDDVINKNMYNLYQYILYLLGEIDENPTDSLDGIPVLAGPQWGVYYPGFSIEVPTPSSAQIKQWIEEDPGYNDDGVGSLNWMTNYYNPWILDNQKPVNVFRTFENWYTANVNITGPFVVVISYYETTAEVEALIKEFEANGQAAFCLYQYTTVEPTMTELLEIACTDKNGFSRGIVAGASLYSWSTSYSEMGTNATTTAYSNMNITILNGISGISQDSYESDYGPQTEWTYQVTVAEFEGVIAPVVISYVSNDGTTVVLDEGVAKLAQLTMGYANLKTEDNKDKKVAIILYDYPPGKANIGASYLDVYTSTHDLLVQLAEAGYDVGMSVEEIPTTEELATILIDIGNKGSYASGLLNTYVEENYDDLTANHQLISESEWDEMYDSLPENLQIQLTDCWSTGLGNGSMIYNDSYLVIPGIYFGNIFITIQPARGWDEVTDYHSDTLAPPQQYVAFYKYLYNYYQGIEGNSVDAMISMGTHGTLEWLPGRTMGLQYDDWTFQLTEVPIIYPYIVSNPGEGMTAKDRSFAQVITHMTPVMTASTLYGEYLEISDAISSYKSNVKLGDTQNVEYYKSLILNLTTGVNGSFTSPNFQKMLNNITNYYTALNAGDEELMQLSKENIDILAESLNKSMNAYFNYTLPESMTFDEYLEYMTEYCESDEAFDSWLSSIENSIESMSGDTITYGMHTLGYVWNDTEMVQGITSIATSRTEILQHIQEIYFNIDGDYYENIKDSDFAEYQTAIESTLESIITRLVDDTSIEMVNTIAAQVNQDENSAFYQDLLSIKGYIDGVRDNNEWNAILTALDGGYVMPGLSGEPSLSDVLPTGRSMYSSDTTKMPTKAAWNTAVNAVDALLIAYMEDLGEDTYPELVGQVIWGTEVLRTEGVSLAMYLYLLGVTPTWAADGTVTGVEVIPLEDLTITIDGVVYQRPRIDVFATIVTSNTNWLKLLTDAVDMVNDLDESVNDNYVKKHYAEINSTFRLFGLNGAKLEGTGVSDLLNNIGSWEDSDDGISYEAASVYESRMDNAWTIDSNGNIQVIADQSEVFAYLLTNVDLIIQDIDSTWQYLDSDDYTDWYGGLLNAANVHGATPNTLLLDIRNKNEISTSTLSQQVSKEVMTTLTNPQWIQAMTASVGGWNQISANYENLVKTIYTTQGYQEDENGKAVHSTGGNSTGAISNELFTKTVEFMVYSEYMVADANYKSYAMQSILGWEMTLAMDNYWQTEDTQLMTDLIQKYVDAVNQYGVACCHHTCGNINLHEWILTTGSALGVKGLERYSEQYYSATGTGTVLGTGTEGTGAGDGSGGSGDGTGGSSGGTQIGDGSFTGYGDVGVGSGSGSYSGGGSGSGSGSGTNYGSMTGSGSGSGTTGGTNGTNGGNGTTGGNNGTTGGNNGTTGGNNGTTGGNNGTTGGNNGTTGSNNNTNPTSGNGSNPNDGDNSGNSNGDAASTGSSEQSGGNSSEVGDASVGTASEGGESASASASAVSAAEASSGATSASAVAYEVSEASGGEAASSYSEIGLGYILIIIGIGCLFALGYRRRNVRN